MSKQIHEWKISGWTSRGRQPCAHEWECIHCGLVLGDGESAKTLYCEVEE